MNQDDLKVLFRTQELQRRAARRQIILSHAALDDSAPDEIEAKAIKQIQQHQAAFEVLSLPQFPTKAYWRRLWAAVRGRAA